MRHFIFDIWIWDKDHHSRLLGFCRFDCNQFPEIRQCEEAMAKDKYFVEFMKKPGEYQVTIGNIREYIP